MKWMVALAVGLGLATGTGHAVNPRYDARGVKLVEATLEELVFETDTEDEKSWEAEIRDQLHYLVSQLRPINATPGLWHSLTMEVKTVSKGAYGKNRIVYGATFLASWPRGGAKTSLPIVFPVRGDAEGMEAFEAKYGGQCGKGPMWYYLNLKNPQCPLGQPELPEDAQRVSLKVVDSPLNTSNKAPEYGKMWEDGKLVITHVMGNVISLARQEQSLHESFCQQHPGATTQVLTDNFFHETQVSRWQTPAGIVELRTMRIKTGNVQEATEEFTEEFRESLKDTDVISYNGHAGLGKNIRAFSKLIKLEPNRYYLMWINACVPFAYFDEAFFEASKEANPDHPWTKHLDIMIATGIGFFAETSDIRELVLGLATKSATFRQLVPKFEFFSPMVLGEEDNNWPKPF